jgi:hypothetical protein
MTKTRRPLALIFAIACAVAATTAANAGKPFDYYTSDGTMIEQFTSKGDYVGQIDPRCSEPDGADVRGFTFGPDNLLYVVCNSYFNDDLVLVLNRKGEPIKAYPFFGDIGGLGWSGSIRFAPGGKYFYLSAEDGVYRFLIGGTAGKLFIQAAVTAMDVMPNGELLVGEGNAVVRYSATGQVLGRVDSLADPYDLAPEDPRLLDVRGVAYDPRTNTTFVTMLGYDGLHDALLALDGTSNVLKGKSSYWYGSEIHVVNGGKLLVGSSGQAAGIFRADGATQPMTIALKEQIGDDDSQFVSSRRPRR